MALETKLLQKLSQSLLMTPQLQQAIKLLQLGRLEYKEAIEAELLENPILEEIKEDDSPEREKATEIYEDTAPASPEEGNAGSENTANGPDWEAYLDNISLSSTSKSSADYEDRPSLEATLTKSETLYEHLLSQLRLAELEKHEEPIALMIIGNLNRDGYLDLTHEEIAEECGCSLEQVERVAGVVKFLDPIGVGSRDLGECLLVQLDNLGLSDGLEAKLLTSYLDKLEKRKYDQIAKAEGIPVDRVYKAVSTIQTLEPRPGRPFADEATRYVVPDIYVYKVGAEYVISLNEDGLPRLRVSPYYLKLLQSDEYGNLPNKTYLNERLKAASWLIKSIQQRQQTIFKVTESIVKFQRAFLDHGIEKLKPLVLKDVADDIGMHESTVSRVTTNKYVHTPQGVYELKFFFTTGIKTAEGDVSSSTIKEKIRNLIAAEPADNPISDQKIVELLKEENIIIARRTVAKYRENLGILSSSQRKKHF